MSKKAIAIIVGVVAAVAIIIVSVIGINARRDNNIYVTGIDISNAFYEESVSDGVKTKTIHIDNEIMSYQIDGYVIPKNATNKDITYTSSNETVATVSETGLVTFAQKESVNILLESKDGAKKILVKLVRVVGTVLTAFDVTIDGDNVNFTAPAGQTMYSQKEGDTLVLYTGAEYQLGTDAQLSIVGTTSVATLSNKVLSTSAAGTFTLRVDEHDVTVKVVPFVNTFDKGASQTVFETEVAKTESVSEYLGGYGDKILVVGKDNAFKFSLDTADNYGHAISATIPLAYTAKEVVSAETKTEVAIDTIATINADFSLTFKAAAKGKVYEISVAPLYNVANRDAKTFTIKVDDGVNVYTNDELVAAFADLSVNKIHLQANIVAELKANQISKEVIGGQEVDRAKNIDQANDADSGAVYKRYVPENYTGDVTELTVEVNGNFFEVDGSGLPLVSYADKTSDNKSMGGALSWAETAGYKISSVQISLFRIQDYRDVQEENAEPMARLAANFTNLKIYGNTAKGPIYPVDASGNVVDIDDNEYTALMADQGSGYNGFMAKNAVMNFENVSVSKFVINITASRQRSEAHMNYVNSFDAWGNGAYAYNAVELEMQNTRLANFGGGAIAVEDPDKTIASDAAWKDLTITIGKNVVIDNMLVGDEGWFIVNGYSGAIVTGLKTGINTGISAMGKTMLAQLEIERPNGQTENASAFNFICQIATAGDTNKASAEGATSFQVTFKLYVGDDEGGNPIYYTTERKNQALDTADDDNTFLGQNVIAQVLGGQYLNALGQYSNMEEFYKLVATVAIISNDVQNYATAAYTALMAEKTIDEFSYEFMCDSVGAAWNGYLLYITNGNTNLTLDDLVTILTANDGAAVVQGIQYLTLQAKVGDAFLRDIAFEEMNEFIEEGIEAIVGQLEANGGYANKDAIKSIMVSYDPAVGLIFDPVAEAYKAVVDAGVPAAGRVAAVKSVLLDHAEIYVGLCQKETLQAMFGLDDATYAGLIQIALAASVTNGDTNALEVISANPIRKHLGLIVTYANTGAEKDAFVYRSSTDETDD